VLAWSVCTLAAMCVFLMHRAVLRGWTLEGEALLGARAALAADSALAWFLEEGWKAQPEGPGQGNGPDGRTVAGGEEILAVPPWVYPGEPAQDGEVHVRFLGPSSRWPGTQLCRLTVVGRVRGPRPFVQTREVYITVPDERGPPTKRAWRILR